MSILMQAKADPHIPMNGHQSMGLAKAKGRVVEAEAHPNILMLLLVLMQVQEEIVMLAFLDPALMQAVVRAMVHLRE